MIMMTRNRNEKEGVSLDIIIALLALTVVRIVGEIPCIVWDIFGVRF